MLIFLRWKALSHRIVFMEEKKQDNERESLASRGDRLALFIITRLKSALFDVCFPFVLPSNEINGKQRSEFKGVKQRAWEEILCMTFVILCSDNTITLRQTSY